MQWSKSEELQGATKNMRNLPDRGNSLERWRFFPKFPNIPLAGFQNSTRTLWIALDAKLNYSFYNGFKFTRICMCIMRWVVVPGLMCKFGELFRSYNWFYYSHRAGMNSITKIYNEHKKVIRAIWLTRRKSTVFIITKRIHSVRGYRFLRLITLE